MRRRMARECAFKALFMVDMGENDFNGALHYILQDTGLQEKEKTFCRELVTGVLQKKEELDQAISEHLINWQLDRLAATVRNILRLALFEILFLDDIPAVVSINEAIEMTKIYQDEEASRFVNGLLDKARKNMKR